MGELRVSEIVGEERGRGGGKVGESYSGKPLLAEEVVVRYWRVESSRHDIYIELVGERVRAVMESRLCRRRATGPCSSTNPPHQHDINYQFGPESRMILKRIVQLVGARTLFNGYFSALARPPPNYEGHIPLNPPERAILAVGSAIGALLNPRRGGKPPPQIYFLRFYMYLLTI